MAILSHNPITASPFPSRGKQHVPLHPVFSDQYGFFWGGNTMKRTMASILGYSTFRENHIPYATHGAGI